MRWGQKTRRLVALGNWPLRPPAGSGSRVRQALKAPRTGNWIICIHIGRRIRNLWLDMGRIALFRHDSARYASLWILHLRAGHDSWIWHTVRSGRNPAGSGSAALRGSRYAVLRQNLHGNRSMIYTARRIYDTHCRISATTRGNPTAPHTISWTTRPFDLNRIFGTTK